MIATLDFPRRPRPEHSSRQQGPSGFSRRQNRSRIDPFGKVTVLDGLGTTVRTATLYGNPWTFTGRRLDQETGLMYYRNRMYSVDLGRFVGRDPWRQDAFEAFAADGYADGFNLYMGYFVPNATDPSGLRDLEKYKARVAEFFQFIRSDQGTYCYITELNELLVTLEKRIVAALDGRKPRVRRNIKDPKAEGMFGAYYPGFNRIRLVPDGSDSLYVHEAIHVASVYYNHFTQYPMGPDEGPPYQRTADTDHNLTEPVEKLLMIMRNLSMYVDSDCQNVAHRQGFIKFAKQYAEQATKSEGLDNDLGFDLQWERYLNVVDWTCCCGKGKNTVKE